MRVIDGKMYFMKGEVAELVGRSPQTIHLWDKWSNELEEGGDERLIPQPYRDNSNYRLWSEEDIDKIKEFAENIQRGDLAKFSRRQWGKRGEKKQGGEE